MMEEMGSPFSSGTAGTDGKVSAQQIETAKMRHSQEKQLAKEGFTFRRQLHLKDAHFIRHTYSQTTKLPAAEWSSSLLTPAKEYSQQLSGDVSKCCRNAMKKYGHRAGKSTGTSRRSPGGFVIVE